MVLLPKHSPPQVPAGLREEVKTYREQPGHPRVGREGADGSDRNTRTWFYVET